MASEPTIHRFPAEHEGAFVNAYLVETEAGVVAVDGLLTVSAAKEMRTALDRLGKPLHAALVTHSHPDHYAGLAEIVAGSDVPIVAPQGVIDTITADDAMKEQIVGPMFGDDWPTTRVFPNTPIRDGESLTFDGVKFTVIDLGPSESPHDSPWVLGDAENGRLPRRPDLRPPALLPRRRLLRRVAREHREAARPVSRRGCLPHRSRRPCGCARCGTGNAGYIETFLDAVADADWSEPESAKATVVARMKAYEPSDQLQMLMELSIEPVAAKQGLLTLSA